MTFLASAPNDVGRASCSRSSPGLVCGSGRLSSCAGATSTSEPGRSTFRAAKTAAGIREVHLTPALRETPTLWRVDAKETGAADFVAQTSTGQKHNPSNLRRNVLVPAVEAENAKLVETAIAPIGRLTFHSLRRTYASLRCAVGDDVRYAAAVLMTP